MKQKVFLRAQYNYDTDDVSNDCGLICPDESLTQQHQKEDADINVIVKRFGLTGQLPQNVRTPSYGDFTGITTYQDALNAVLSAQASFMAMPAQVRARFENNPEKFVEFCSDPKNIDQEMVEWGLAVRKAPAEGAGAPATEQAQPPKAQPAKAG